MRPINRLSHNWLIHLIGNKMVQRRLPTLSGTVLDIGCGERPFEADVLRYADTYVGVDWANTLHHLKADVVADVSRALPFLDDSFDHVMSFAVLEHLSEPDIMLGEVYRVLKSDGTFLLSVPFQWWVHEEPWDYQRFTRFGLEHHLRKAGFNDIEIVATTGFWSMWFLKLNYQLKRLPRGPRPLRRLLTLLLVPFWWLDQSIAPWLDEIWPDERETAGYFVTAAKP